MQRIELLMVMFQRNKENHGILEDTSKAEKTHLKVSTYHLMCSQCTEKNTGSNSSRDNSPRKVDQNSSAMKSIKVSLFTYLIEEEVL
jgi:hypothetical protein